jgi:aspartate ammonia-lyase
MSTRTEEDLLGPREIPAEAYYGVHTLRAIENFRISSVDDQRPAAVHPGDGGGEEGLCPGEP